MLQVSHALVAVLVVGVAVFSLSAQGSFVADVLKKAGGIFGVNLGGAKDALENTAGVIKFPVIEREFPKHGEGISVADFSDRAIPKVRANTRVMDLVHGLHFDDILQDTPNDLRPPAVVVFYDSSDAQCMKDYNALQWDRIAEEVLPARERLFTARYDTYSAPRRSWYKFIPEMDLKKRLKVTKCPELVFVPKKCDGFTEWCTRKVEDGVSYMGCDDFKDQCTGFESWDGKAPMVSWIMDRVAKEGEPKISRFLQTYAEQGIWIQRRDQTSSDNHRRNMYLSEAFPAFTHNGFKAMPIPQDFNEWLLSFYERNLASKRTEFWDSESTQMSFTETQTQFIDLDRERLMKEKYANEVIKPIVEEWSGMSPLKLTSFYGMREYPNESFLKNHVDRIDTHVLSVTMTVKKLDKEAATTRPWPLEVAQWSGDHVRYDHDEGTMVLYESSKLPHGRPYRNHGGPHVGAFIHFKPVSMDGDDAKKWDSIATRARANQAKHTAFGQYRSTATKEPENPVFSEVNYAADTKWTHLGEDSQMNDSSFEITFSNNADRILDVHWKSPEGAPRLQGSVGPGSQFTISSFQGHKFFWAEHGSTDPLPAGTMTAEMGRPDYEYKL